MYIFLEDAWYGTDRVVWAERCEAAAGDLFWHQKKIYGICLGKEIAFPELRSDRFAGTVTSEEVLISGVLSERALGFIHRFVGYRYTTYRHTIPLFLGTGLQQILMRKQSASKKKSLIPVAQLTEHGTIIPTDDKLTGQQLCVFPHLWSLSQCVDSVFLSHAGVSILHGQMTEKQKAESFRKCKMGSSSLVFCTYSQIFQDWHALEEVICVDQHTRWYKNQQEPRYSVMTVLEKFAEYTHARLQTTGLLSLAAN